ncbi:hypothetical protein BO83DRAFT_213064 [Aspergillus eucalypticola CBS 122712]|uniref:Uncharacterized protein n=1 Tax=Aspergillus eucalypticola (strain CBS 122712 / IBT 29274) TaxID=1448314 RepID=A0A317VY15_ASPEC|nr:uncharacterized protein BO83DRAFT_213064 [Aspergillus eucalypticola CBS 122712]PWY78675.1 hypothetical protein BO83DRAFT_213064 [Aspergillus eucalypticola CBS 122712]
MFSEEKKNILRHEERPGCRRGDPEVGPSSARGREGGRQKLGRTDGVWVQLVIPRSRTSPPEAPPPVDLSGHEAEAIGGLHLSFLFAKRCAPHHTHPSLLLHTLFGGGRQHRTTDGKNGLVWVWGEEKKMKIKIKRDIEIETRIEGKEQNTNRKIKYRTNIKPDPLGNPVDANCRSSQMVVLVKHKKRV